ncbi:ABC transporter permease [Tunicatimonas pelagia]|uniref:ABC transporter permease n=1 Tax=Tunicatimonas pelagia TaxID=931531 RepID=UPI002666ABB0|nr:ABC transporter permease [Tunicatimonas pelagia]WKN43463.1 ABC transporter permease [Tunicatimonas pelagia]
MIKNYLLIAFRHFWKQKLFSSINIIGLSLGIACSLLVYLWVQYQLGYDQSQAKKDNTFLVLGDWSYSDGSRDISLTTPANLAEELKQNISGIAQTTRLVGDWSSDNILQVGDALITQTGIYADSTFLSIFTYPLARGNPQQALVNSTSIVINRATANALFGAEEPLGKTITVRDKEGNREYVVSGVLADQPLNNSLSFDFILPYPDLENRHEWLKKWGSSSVVTAVELEDPTQFAEINRQIRPMITRYKEDLNFELRLFSYADLHLRSPFRTGEIGLFSLGSITYVYLFSAIALLVLTIACINFVNLATAQASQRATEVGVRKAVGGSRQVLTGQFLYESLLTVTFATGLALLLVELGFIIFDSLLPEGLSVPYHEAWFIVSLLSVIAGTTLLAGSYPALILSSLNPVKALKGGTISGTRGSKLRPVLVTSQFVLSTILLTGTLAIYLQIQYVQEKNLGLDRSNVIGFSTNPTINQHFSTFKQSLLQHPAFVSVTRGGENPLNMQSESSDPYWLGKTEDDNRAFNLAMIDYDFFRTLDVSLVAGRSFSPEFSQDTINYIINEEAARQMGLENPVGSELHFWRGKGQIVGVVKDFHYHSLHQPIGSIIFMLWPGNAEEAYIRIAPGQTSEAVDALQQVYAQYQPDVPLDYHFLDESFDQMYRYEQRIGSIVNVFAVLAIIISALGLLGMATYTAQRRQKEIGVRKVLGASVSQLLLLLSSQYLKLVVIALAIAIPVANFLLAEWLNSFAYHIDRQWWLFALPAGLLFAVILLSVGGQTLKAAQQNPVDSLKDE